MLKVKGFDGACRSPRMRLVRYREAVVRVAKAATRRNGGTRYNDLD
jgi:hypothetical protein